MSTGQKLNEAREVLNEVRDLIDPLPESATKTILLRMMKAIWILYYIKQKAVNQRKKLHEYERQLRNDEDRGNG